jgi:hypothetical protein
MNRHTNNNEAMFFLTLEEIEKEIKSFSPKYNTNLHSIECVNTA